MPSWKKDNPQMVGNNILNGNQIVEENNGILSEKKNIAIEHRTAWGKDSGIQPKVIETDKELFKRNEQEKEKERDQVRVPGWSNQEKAKTKKKRSRKKREEKKREDNTYNNNIDPNIDEKNEELNNGNGDTITTNGVKEKNEARKNTNYRHVKKVTQVRQNREQCEKRQAGGEGSVKWDEEEDREEPEEPEESEEPEEPEEPKELEAPEEPERDEQEERGNKDAEENKEKHEVTNNEGNRERDKEKHIKEFVQGSVGEIENRSYKEVVHMNWEDRLNEYEEEVDEYGKKNVDTVETEEMVQLKKGNQNNDTNVNAKGEKETKKKKKKKKKGKNGAQQKRSNQNEKKEEADKITATNNTQITCSNKNNNGSDEENKNIVNKFPKKKIMLLKRNEGKREKDVHEDKKKQEYNTAILNTAKDEKTLEQREEEYNKIRARIFSDFNGGININNNDHNNNNNNSMSNNHGYNSKKNNLKMDDPGNIYFNYLANNGAFPYMNSFCNMYANNPYNLVYSPGNMMMHPGINTVSDVPSYYFQEGNVSHFPNYLCNFQNQQNFVNAANFFPYASTNDSSNTHNGNSYSSSNNNNNNNNSGTSVPATLCVEGYANNFVNINGSNNMNMNANLFGNHSLSKNTPGGKRKTGKGGNNTNVINNAMIPNSGIMNLANSPNSILDNTNVNSKMLTKMNKSNKMNKINKAFCEPHNIMLGNQMYNNTFLMNNMYLNDVTQKNMNASFFSPYSSSNTFQYPYKNNMSTMNQSNVFVPYNRDSFASVPISSKMNKGGKENKNFCFNKNTNTSGMNKKNVITASAELNKNFENKETEKESEYAGRKCGTGAALTIEGEKREDRKKMEFVEKRRNVTVKDNVEEDVQGEENEAENDKKNIKKSREKHVRGKIDSRQKEDVTQFDAEKNDSATLNVSKKEKGEEEKEKKEEEKEEKQEEEEVEVEEEGEEEEEEVEEEEVEEEEKEEEEGKGEGEEVNQNIREREHDIEKGAENNKPAATSTENRHTCNKYPNKNNKSNNNNKGNNSSNASNNNKSNNNSINSSNNKSINSNNSSTKNNNSSNNADLNTKGNDTFNKKAEYMKRETFKNPYVDNKMYKNMLMHMQPIAGASPLPQPPLPPSGEEMKEQRKAFHMNKKGMGKTKRNIIGSSSANSDIYAYNKVVENASLSYLYSGIQGIPPMREAWNKHKKTHSNNVHSSSNNMNTSNAHGIHHNNVINNNNAVRGEGNDPFNLATNVANSSAHESLSGENILKKKKTNKKKKKNPLKEMNHNMPYIMNTAGNSLLSFYLNNNERPYMYNPSAIPNSTPNLSYNPNRTMNMHMNYNSSLYTNNTNSMGSYYNHSYYPQNLINDLDYCRDAALFEKRFDKGDDLPPSFKRYDVDFPSL